VLALLAELPVLPLLPEVELELTLLALVAEVTAVPLLLVVVLLLELELLALLEVVPLLTELCVLAEEAVDTEVSDDSVERVVTMAAEVEDVEAVETGVAPEAVLDVLVIDCRVLPLLSVSSALAVLLVLREELLLLVLRSEVLELDRVEEDRLGPVVAVGAVASAVVLVLELALRAVLLEVTVLATVSNVLLLLGNGLELVLVSTSDRVVVLVAV